MLDGVLGRLLNGALWGLGAALVMGLTQKGEGGLRPVGRALMKGYVVAADRITEATAEARENIEDLYHEAKSERGDRTEPSANGQDSPARRTRRSDN